jgi:hypothetical protein
MLVDDGWDVVFSRTLFEKLSVFNFIGFGSQLLENGGRFRPVYWLYHTAVWFIGRNSYQFHHLAHMLVIGVSMLFIYLIVKELTNSKWASFFAALFYLLVPLNTENVFRLGPQEPLLAMFLGILFYLLIKNEKILLSCIIVFFAIFTKETSVALLPVLLIYFIYSRKGGFVKNKNQGYYLWITICVASILLVLITFLRRGGYSTYYYLDFPMVVGNLIVYFKELTNNTFLVFPVIPAIYLIRIGARLIGKRKVFNLKLDLFQLLFFAGFLCFIVLQLPWRYSLSRYLMPAGLFLILFSFIEINEDIKLLGNINFVKIHKRIFTLALSSLVFYVFLIWGLDFVFKATSGISYLEAFARMASYPKDTILLMNMQKGDSTIELVVETQIHLSEFWNRGDIMVEYLDLQQLPKGKYVIVDSNQFPRAYSQDSLNLMFKNMSNSIEKTSMRVVLTTPLGLIKQSAKKLFGLLVYKKELLPDGIYTYYYNYNNWYFFNE